SELATPRGRAPRGFVVNRRLGAVRGVAAWSDPTEELAIVRIGAVTGVLPPPLGQLWTLGAAPVQSLPGGGQIVRLEGGILPLFAAVAIDDGEEVYGLGYTAAAARRALGIALR